MYSKIKSGMALGIEGEIIDVEADISSGLPTFTLVGYLSASVKEASERVRTALKNQGVVIPPKRITINLSPADIKKDGTGFDLAIAMSILVSLQVIPNITNLNTSLFMGELGLGGDILPISGVLPVVDYAAKKGYTHVFLPKENVEEASLVNEIKVIGLGNLSELIGYFTDYTNFKYLEEHVVSVNISRQVSYEYDMSQIKGQKLLKRAVEIAAAGFHNILLQGAAGAGKSLIAKCMPSILPELTYEEQMTLTKIYSVNGMLDKNNVLIETRPFRSPHHTITDKALMGGGLIPRPGEVSLANHGVLFLDEFPEFKKSVIEALRQPLEDRKVTISRVHASYDYPANFLLMCAMNICPCGHFPDRNRCTCTDRQIKNYQNRISYPILDRIDIGVNVKPVTYADLFSTSLEESSEVIRSRVEKARLIQRIRYDKEDFLFNSEIPQDKIDVYIKVNCDIDVLKSKFENNNLSARSYFRVLRLARTIADLANHELIEEIDIDEALFFKNSLRRDEVNE